MCVCVSVCTYVCGRMFWYGTRFGMEDLPRRSRRVDGGLEDPSSDGDGGRV